MSTNNQNAIDKICSLIEDGEVQNWTTEQRVKVVEVVERWGSDKLLKITPVSPICPYVGLQFESIFIGVEPDGHAHS